MLVRSESWSKTKTANYTWPIGHVQRGNFVKSLGGQSANISICGQESNSITRRLAFTNLALHSVEVDFVPENANTFRCDLDFIGQSMQSNFLLAV